MPEPVIVATARSPIGRAFKGSLVELRPDDLAAGIVAAALAKVPELDPSEIEDLMLGCGLPGGEQGYNMARVVAILAGLPEVPGCTVNRYCSSSLQTIRMAAHAIQAGEGDVFVAAGVEWCRRFVKGTSDTCPTPATPASTRPRNAPRPEPGRGGAVGAGGGRPARHLHRHGPDGGERGPDRGRLPGGDGRLRRSVAAAGGGRPEAGFFDREIIPVALPNGTRHRRRRAPAGHHAGEARRAQAGLPPRRDGDGRQRLPAQRRRRRRGRHERHAGPGARDPPLARIVATGVTPSTPRSWAWARSRPAARRCAGRA